MLGEYTVASILGYQPFAVWIVSLGGSNAQMSVAVSVLSLVLTWVLLLLLAAAGRGRSPVPRAGPAGPAEPRCLGTHRYGEP